MPKRVKPKIVRFPDKRVAVTPEDAARSLRVLADKIESGKLGNVNDCIVVVGNSANLAIHSITPPDDRGTAAAIWGMLFAALVRDIMAEE